MLPDRYSSENIRRAVRNPELFVRESQRLSERVKLGLKSSYGALRFGEPFDIMEEDWDYLFILDACRYDIMEAHCPFGWEILPRISNGSHSREFFRKTFDGETCHDTVYVTANGWGAKICENVFHDIIFTDVNYATSNSDFNFTHPSWRGLAPTTVETAAREAYETYTDKRLIVHFMQPHSPYFGNRAADLRENLRNENILVTARQVNSRSDEVSDGMKTVPHLTAAAREGFISPDELREVYTENLEIVLESVDSLLSDIEGKVAITADHGEHLGERVGLRRQRRFDHFEHMYTKELRQVPWTSIQTGPRPDILAEPPRRTALDEQAVHERLQTLGYIS